MFLLLSIVKYQASDKLTKFYIRLDMQHNNQTPLKVNYFHVRHTSLKKAITPSNENCDTCFCNVLLAAVFFNVALELISFEITAKNLTQYVLFHALKLIKPTIFVPI